MAELQGLEGIPGVTPSFISFVHSIRLYMRDYAHLNRLVRGEESSDRMIAWAILDFLSDFSGTPPILGNYTLDDLLDRGLSSLARYGVVTVLLESIGLLQTRNHLNFSDGGINVAISDKTPLLQSWLQLFRAKYEEQKLRVKVQFNIEQLWGTTGVYSEYSAINGFYGFW